MSDTTPEPSKGQRTAGLVATILLLLAGVLTVRDFLPALAWAVVIAIGVWPLFSRMAKRWPKRKRDVLPALIIVGILMVLILPLTLIGYRVFADARGVAQWLEQARDNGAPPPDFLQHLPYGQSLTQLWQANLGQPQDFSKVATRVAQGGVLTVGRRFGVEALHRLALVGFMMLALFFLLRDAEAVAAQARLASRRALGSAGERVGLQMIRAVQGAVNGLVLVGLGEGLILGAAYWIAGGPYPTLFMLGAAILSMVPFGASVAIVAGTLALLMQERIAAAIVIAVLGAVTTFIADHFVRPILIGGAARLPFIWVLLGILGGVEAWGLVGLFIGPAILAALMLLWREYVGEHEGPLSPKTEPAPRPRAQRLKV